MKYKLFLVLTVTLVTGFMFQQDTFANGDESLVFDTNGGSEIAPITGGYGESTDGPEDPTKDGYKFAGWFSDEELTFSHTFPSLLGFGPQTLYAKWDEMEYTVTYELDGGVNHPHNPDTYTVLDSFYFGRASKTGFTFDGWYTDLQDENSLVTYRPLLTEDTLTLYAKYKPLPVILANPNNGDDAYEIQTLYTESAEYNTHTGLGTDDDSFVVHELFSETDAYAVYFKDDVLTATNLISENVFTLGSLGVTAILYEIKEIDGVIYGFAGVSTNTQTEVYVFEITNTTETDSTDVFSTIITTNVDNAYAFTQTNTRTRVYDFDVVDHDGDGLYDVFVKYPPLYKNDREGDSKIISLTFDHLASTPTLTMNMNFQIFGYYFYDFIFYDLNDNGVMEMIATATWMNSVGRNLVQIYEFDAVENKYQTVVSEFQVGGSIYQNTSPGSGVVHDAGYLFAGKLFGGTENYILLLTTGGFLQADSYINYFQINESFEATSDINQRFTESYSHFYRHKMTVSQIDETGAHGVMLSSRNTQSRFAETTLFVPNETSTGFVRAESGGADSSIESNNGAAASRYINGRGYFASTILSRFDTISAEISGKVPLVPAPASREGYSFMGWYTTEDFQPGTTIRKDDIVEDDFSIYAYFQPKEYDIRFYLYNQNFSIYDQVKVTFDEFLMPEDEIEVAHYEFIGWRTGTSATAPLYDFTKPYTDPSITRLYATYKNLVYTVTHVTNTDEVIPDYSADSLSYYDLPTDVVKEGFTFAGWYDSEDFDTPVLPDRLQLNQGDMTIYARFVSLPPVITPNITDFTIEAGNSAVNLLQFFTFSDDNTDVSNLTYRIIYDESILQTDSLVFNQLGEEVIMIELTDEDDNTTSETFTFTVVDTTAPIYDFDNHETVLNEIDILVFVDDVLDFYNFEPYDIEQNIWEEELTYTFTYEEDGQIYNYTEDNIFDWFSSRPSTGVYQLIEYVSDDSGNTSSLTINFNFVYVTNMLELTSNYYVRLGDTFDLTNLEIGEGLEAYELEYSGEVNAAVLGMYQIAAKLYDPISDEYLYELTYDIIVTDEDYFVPVITASDFDLPAGYDLPDISTYYSVNDDSEFNVDVTHDIDVLTPGDYPLVIIATDIFDNVSMKTVIVTILAYESFDITFVVNGGSSQEVLSFEYLSTITLPDDPTRTGYSFDGWYEDAELTTLYEDTTMDDEDLTLYASWTINSYTLTFDLQNGSNETIITLAYDTEVTSPDDPTRTGYKFDGWDGVIPENMPAENKTFKALWTINTYTLTFDLQDGSSVTTITQAYDTEVTSPDDPTRTGYTFDGWDGVIPENMPAENKTFKALWTINTYTLTFDLQDGSNVTTITQAFDTEVTSPEVPTRTGYTFNGWDGVIPENMPAENKTFMALWLTLNTQSVDVDSIVNGLIEAIDPEIIEGKDVEVMIEIQRYLLNDVDEDDRVELIELIESLNRNVENVLYLDIQVIVRESGQLELSLEELSDNVEITVTIPADQQGFKDYQVIRVHNGVAEVLESTFDEENQTLTFETDRFSTYALIYDTSSGTWLWWLLLLLVIPVGYASYKYRVEIKNKFQTITKKNTK